VGAAFIRGVTMPRLRIEDLKRELAARLPDILPRILSDARPHGRGRWKGYTSAGELAVVEIAGHKRGFVYNTSGGPGSGSHLFNLIVSGPAGGSVSEGCRIAHALLGISWEGLADAEWLARERQRSGEATQRQEAARARMLHYRATEYHNGTTQTPTSPSGLYLINRGCGLSDVLRDHPSRYSAAIGELQTMIGPMVDPRRPGAAQAYHLTYLQRDGGTFRKVALEPAKKTFGWTAGCIIPLLRGQSGLTCVRRARQICARPC
jgi:hypothetical protein